MRKLNLIVVYFLLPFFLKAQLTANISLSDIVQSGNDLLFTINIMATGGDIYLGNADFRFAYNYGIFTNPTTTKIQEHNFVAASDGSPLPSASTYPFTAEFKDGETIFSSSVQNSGANDLAATAKLTSNILYRVGRFRISGITSAGASGLVMSDIIVKTMDPTTFQESNVTTAATNNVLPLELLSFEVKATNGTASLSWQTTNEENVNYFEIQKSADSKEFTPIHKTAAIKGVSQTYTAIDEKPYTGMSYYRLKMVDLDGHFTYSAIKSVVFEGSKKMNVKIYPNPASNQVNIEFQSQNADLVDFELSNINGQIVYTYKLEGRAGNNRLFFITRQFPAGLYTLKIKQGNIVAVEKVILK